MELKMDVGALEAFLARDFPQVSGDFEIVDVAPMEVVVALTARDAHLRPGGTVSGPSMFALADVSAYLALLAMMGPVALAVTTNCSIDFMRKPVPGRLLCRAHVLKLGRVLAVIDARLFSDGDEIRPVARATLTYAIPPKSNGIVGASPLTGL